MQVAQQAEVLADNPDDFSSILETNITEKEQTPAGCPLTTCTPWHIHACACIHM